VIRLPLAAKGIPTVDRMTLGATPIVRRALLAGEIDLVVQVRPRGEAAASGSRDDLSALDVLAVALTSETSKSAGDTSGNGLSARSRLRSSTSSAAVPLSASCTDRRKRNAWLRNRSTA